jgi:hypothetical protein
VGSAVNDTTREVGGALGVAIIGSVASSLFASRLHPFLAHVPAPAAAEAKASVGAAVAVGSHTPGSVGQALVEAARQAFVSGTDRAVLVAVAAAVLGSLVAFRYLPARARSEATSERFEPVMVEPAPVELAPVELAPVELVA